VQVIQRASTTARSNGRCTRVSVFLSHRPIDHVQGSGRRSFGCFGQVRTCRLGLAGAKGRLPSPVSMAVTEPADSSRGHPAAFNCPPVGREVRQKSGSQPGTAPVNRHEQTTAYPVPMQVKPVFPCSPQVRQTGGARPRHLTGAGRADAAKAPCPTPRPPPGSPCPPPWTASMGQS
jgi:hypothetical protein